jgi:hypothetical protein
VTDYETWERETERKMSDTAFPPPLLDYWSRFLSAERTLDDLFADPLIFPLQRRRELERMFSCVVQMPVSYMEVGADKGGGLWAWLNRFPSITRVVAAEIRGTPYSELFERAFPRISFLWLRSSYADESVHAVRRFLGSDPLDVLFIDGDKHGFEKDYGFFGPLVRPGGTAFFHDVRDTPGPREAWGRISAAARASGRRVEHLLDVSEADEAVARERAGVPTLSPHESWLRHWHGESCSVGVVFH